MILRSIAVNRPRVRCPSATISQVYRACFASGLPVFRLTGTLGSPVPPRQQPLDRLPVQPGNPERDRGAGLLQVALGGREVALEMPPWTSVKRTTCSVMLAVGVDPDIDLKGAS